MGWLGFGTAVWIAATGALAFLAGSLFGSGQLIYWLSTVTICAMFVLLFVATAQWSRTPRLEWGRAGSLFAAPGLLGEVIVMLNFGAAVPSLPAAMASRYAAFLFLGYGTLLVTAAWASSRETSQTA
ncbi:MAG TPA: DUF5367 family protein [Ramlibacter sp.]|jgi:hypothetical protein